MSTMGTDDEDIAVSGGSGWEDFGTDEAKHALENYHNNVTLFEDAAADVDIDDEDDDDDEEEKYLSSYPVKGGTNFFNSTKRKAATTNNTGTASGSSSRSGNSRSNGAGTGGGKATWRNNKNIPPPSSAFRSSNCPKYRERKLQHEDVLGRYYGSPKSATTKFSICHIDGRTLCLVTVAMAVLSMTTIALAIFFTTSARAELQDWKKTHNFFDADPSMLPTGNLVPPQYANLSNVYDPLSSTALATGGGDVVVHTVPLLWDIPGDGNFYQHILSKCVGLVAAGGALGDPRQTKVKFDEPLGNFTQANGCRYVNVWTGSNIGIRRGVKTDVVESGMIDVIYAPLIYESMALLSSSYMGQLFALFHHPVDRIASVVKVTQEMYPDLYGRDTLEQFLQANPNNDNWMTRNLAGGQLGAVDEKQYQIARDVLRSKGLVGLSTDLNGAVERVIRYFNWGNRITDQSKFQQCVIDETKKDESTPDGLYFGLYPEGSLEWNITVQHNYYDMRLYEFALTLFAEQGSSASTLATGYDSKNTISSIAKSGTSSGESATTTPSSSSSVSNGGAQSCDFVIGLLLFVITSILILDVRAA